MTILAGIIALSEESSIPSEMSRALKTNISRYADDKAVSFIHPSAHMFKVDIGILGSPGEMHQKGLGTLMLAGETLIESGLARDGRTDDVTLLFADFLDGRSASLSATTGTFCGVFFDARLLRLQLFCDKSGVRPLYFARLGSLVVYASAMRILESIVELKKEIDIRGCAEIACFGYSLGDRTSYSNVKVVDAGTILTFEATSSCKHVYHDWRRIANEGQETRNDSPEEAWRIFEAGIKRRLNGESTALAFLSGGLDSRAIAGALTDVGTKVASINFAPPDTQDQAFARFFAVTIDAQHSEFPVTSAVVGDPHRSKLVRDWIGQISKLPFFGGVKRQMLWSGDGGSVGMGHVYLTANMLKLARTLGFPAAVDEFMRHNNWGLAPRLFVRTSVNSIPELPKKGMIEELQSYGLDDPGKALYLFLMLNDQRRHLQKHFETIDRSRLELHLPFFDGELLEFVMRSDIDQFIGHGFYMRWLASSRVPLMTTPWQAYPGHVPCPIAAPEQLKYQWGGNPFDTETIRRMKSLVIKSGWRMLLQKSFPSRVVRRSSLLSVVLGLMIGRAHLQYLIKMAEAFCEPSRIAGRR